MSVSLRFLFRSNKTAATFDACGRFIDAVGAWVNTRIPEDSNCGKMSSSEDLVAVWEVPMNTGVHTVEFEHGTATGKRVIRVNGREVLRRDWMFRLVGEETFCLESRVPCTIKIEPSGPFGYAYTIAVDGKTLDKFAQAQCKATCTWLVTDEDREYRVVLERGTLDIWVNGDRAEATGEFVENGTETHFTIGSTPAYIKAVSSCNKKEGLLYSLIVNDTVIDPSPV